MTQVDWRNAFFRLLGWYAHEKLGTCVDLVDASPANTANSISSSIIEISFTVHKDGEVDFGKVKEVVQTVADALKLPSHKVSVVNNQLRMIFKEMT